jgi:[ribosomal protein S18]-alanine N-acetyltransferase
MNGIRVERLRGPADLDGVVEIERASFHNPTSKDWYEGELTRPDVCFMYVLRTEDRAVAGFCAFWRVGDQIHINNFAIHPEMRRQGLGRALLAHVLAEATAMGAPNATLEVRRSNTAAQRLYEASGFVLTAIRPAYYTHPVEDALLLSRHGPPASPSQS